MSAALSQQYRGCATAGKGTTLVEEMSLSQIPRAAQVAMGMLCSRRGLFGAGERALRFALTAPAPECLSESELEPALRLALDLELEALLELDEEPDCGDEDELAA